MGHPAIKGLVLMLMLSIFSLAAAGAPATINAMVNTTGHGGGDAEVQAELFYPNGTLIESRTQNSTVINATWGMTIITFSQTVPDDADYIIRSRAWANPPVTTQALPENVTIHPPPSPTPSAFDAPIALDMEYVIRLHSPGNDSIQPNMTQFIWDFSYDQGSTAIHRLIIDNDPDFSSPEINITNSEENHTLTSAQALTDDTYYWKVQIHDPFLTPTLVTESETRTFRVNEGSVSIQNITPTGWFNTDQTISFETTLPAECRYATANNTPFDAKNSMDTTGTQTHSADIPFYQEGENTFYFQCNNTMNGVLSEDTPHVLYYDTTPPSPQSASVSIENGSTYATSTLLDISWSGFNDISNISRYYYNTSNNQMTTQGFVETGTETQMSVFTQGNVSVYVWGEDSAGNIGNASSDWIIIDTLPPSFVSTSWTNLNLYSTGDMQITVTLQDTSPLQDDAPTIRYNLWDTGWEGPVEMTPGTGDLQGGQEFTFNITGSWGDHANQTVNFSINAEDIHGWQQVREFSETITFTVTPPEFDPIPDMTLEQREEVRFNITASDVDNDQLSFTSDNNNISITKINNTLATVSWTPGPTVSGEVPVIFTVSDQVHNVTQTVTFNIIDVNDPPFFNVDKTEYEAYNYEQFNLTINATDYDGDQISFRTNSSAFQISNNGIIRSYPSADQRGTHRINITITDEYGLSNWMEITIHVNYCGDDVCNDIESCETCRTDCGICDDSESSAIIIYPRNCLEDSMTIKAVKLVPRATCETQGLIIDGMEACGALEEEDITVERVINNTYEEVMSLMTDSEGLVTFTPKEKGQYRLSLQGGTTEEFHTKDCISEEEEESSDDTNIIRREDEPVDTSIEKPGEIKRESEFRLWPFLIMIILVAIIGVFGGHYGYAYEVRRIKAGTINQSAYVNIVDKALTYWYLLLDDIKRRARQNEFIYYLGDTIKERIQTGKEKISSFSNSLNKAINPFLKKIKSKHLKVPFIKITNITYEKSLLLTLLSAHMHVHKWLKKKILLEKVRDIPATKNNSLIRMAYASTNLNNTVEISDNVKYSKNHHDLDLLKKTIKRGARYKKREMTIEQLKKEMKKGVIIAQILAQDPQQENRYVRNNVIITGYNDRDIIYHDYLNNIKNRRVKKILFYTAWKNANFRMIRISR
ncbi:MAG: Ig-like domain-containing protein [Candidatus Woesearchaeota archaeon]